MDFDLTVIKIAGDDASSVPMNHNQIEHVRARVHFHSANTNLALEGLVGTEEQLLPCLAAGIKCARDLSAAEGTVVEEPSVLAREGYALRDALVDDVHTDLCEAVDIGLACAKVAALDGVVEERLNAVTIIMIILRGVDAALGRNGVSTARAVLIAKALHVVAEFAEAGRGSAPGKSRPDNYNVVLALVRRIDQPEGKLVFVPGL